jgi:hypothetical protein
MSGGKKKEKENSPTFFLPPTFIKRKCLGCGKMFSVPKARLKIAKRKARFCFECQKGFESSGYRPWFSPYGPWDSGKTRLSSTPLAREIDAEKRSRAKIARELRAEKEKDNA